MTPPRLSDLIHQACLLEARARKPGNVHPEASFPDLCYEDFERAAGVVAEILPRTPEIGVGAAVLAAVRGTQDAMSRATNPNLGIILLLTPLAAVPREIPLKAGIEKVLAGLTIDDARQVYAAINLAKPGGMGKVEQADVSQVPSITLRAAMELASAWDSIAFEYTTGYRITLNAGVPFLAEWPNFNTDWEIAIIHLQLTLMSRHPDTLISRKCGRELAEQASSRARSVLEAGGMRTEPGRQQLSQFDAWLRADGHRRNPGTTADLIVASLFAAARDGKIELGGLEST